jgi:predicted phosphatase
MIYRYSPGETTEVYGFVSGLSGKPVPRQGEILYLIVELENGKVVEVRKPDFVVFKKNKRVQLKATKSSILGNVRYTFVNYQKN